MIKYILIIILSGSLSACSYNLIKTDDGIFSQDFPDLSGDYLGQDPPGLIPEIFAPFLVSEAHNIHSAIVFYPSKKEAYFSIYPKDDLPQSICVTKLNNGRWARPMFVPFSGDFQDGGPILSETGKRMYFYSKRSLDGGNKTSEDTDIWYVNRVRKGWSDPVHENSIVNSDQSEAFLYPGRNGAFFFTRFYSADSTLLLHAKIKDDQFKEVQIIKNLKDIEHFSDPISIEGENYFIFTKNTKRGKYYYASLHISFRESDGSWTPAKDMGDMINHGEGRFSSLSPDGKYLFFVSYRTGISRFYWVNAKIIDYLRSNDLNLIDQITEKIRTEGFQKGRELFEVFKKTHSDYYEFDQRLMSGVGLTLLDLGDNEKALETLIFNHELFPEDDWIRTKIAELKNDK